MTDDSRMPFMVQTPAAAELGAAGHASGAAASFRVTAPAVQPKVGGMPLWHSRVLQLRLLPLRAKRFCCQCDLPARSHGRRGGTAGPGPSQQHGYDSRRR
jgi:hypothetical protein